MIKRLSGADTDAVYACFTAAYPDPWSVESLRATLSAEAGFAWAWQEEGGAVLGFVLFQVAVDTADMLMLATHPDKRRLGIAEAMWRHAIVAFERIGVAQVHLEVAQGNAPAHSFYVRMGFTNQGMRRNYYNTEAGRVDAICMCHDLTRVF